jgi:hypothetical protein
MQPWIPFWHVNMCPLFSNNHIMFYVCNFLGVYL